MDDNFEHDSNEWEMSELEVLDAAASIVDVRHGMHEAMVGSALATWMGAASFVVGASLDRTLEANGPMASKLQMGAGFEEIAQLGGLCAFAGGAFGLAFVAVQRRVQDIRSLRQTRGINN